MVSAIARRIARLESDSAAVVPNIVEVAHGETDDEAVVRFIAKYGAPPRSCIVVPMRVTADQRVEREAAWAAMQRKLIADARDRRSKERNEHEYDPRFHSGSNGQSRRILSAASTADAADADAWRPRKLQK
ncbi:hypothetical protein ATE68_02345 [Sphingopyxis sp. H038]|uniref:hypothetical protein n=1 Tax=unclassified Sphingopyxis TaxID=2614943 RepID=UPI000731A445|nr:MULTISPECIES: hypothetical protein [unclassified Sphingopyxis]KTD99373.1 hypothetical protein ATE78_23590 [Sphingopyxis sp. H012]KTE13299.1 hypothetical protein ATE70_01075 [Sphingopyxis sp. H053]KTE14487.1 hypothetical protein ATE76_08635 [Sphingopyxis sp. H093]KTE31139.1 hypothetical protein ATE75_01050 [Sphingopyxis sp. H080]KTE36989.1 hypothetical protein ATE68_02345 [Sphingopyxis sp. H038]